jgi:hypothetical protein
MAAARDIMTVNKAISWARRSHRTLRAGPSQELGRESHQFRSDLSQDFRLEISGTLLRTTGQGAESQQFRPYYTVGLEAVHMRALSSRSARNPTPPALILGLSSPEMRRTPWRTKRLRLMSDK